MIFHDFEVYRFPYAITKMIRIANIKKPASVKGRAWG